jgi:alpha-beta hydrolase superfamily lysophospholipase
MGAYLDNVLHFVNLKSFRKNMSYSEYGWELAGKKVFARAWTPEGNPRAVINLVHGLGEHSGRYTRWGGLFSDAGYALVVMDLLGHGQSGGKRGHMESYRFILDQVGLMLDKSAENFPGIPLILYGHSMGGNIAMNYVISKAGSQPSDNQLTALIASSPWLRLVKTVTNIEKVFSTVSNMLLPGLTIKTGRIGAELLSNDPEHWEDLRNDPMAHRKVTVRCAYEVMKHGELAIREAGRISIPFLLMHGNADEITSYRATEEAVSSVGHNGQFKIWEGFRHELHNALEHEEVFKYITGWINELKL